MNKLRREEAWVGDLAQDRPFCHCAQICACLIAALYPPPSHAWCSHSADFITTQLSGSRNPFYQSLKALWQRRQRNNTGDCHFSLPLACHIVFVRQHWSSLALLAPAKKQPRPYGMGQLDLFPQKCQCSISSGLLQFGINPKILLTLSRQASFAFARSFPETMLSNSKGEIFGSPKHLWLWHRVSSK